VIAIATQGDDEINNLVEHTIYIPQAPELLLPILEVVPPCNSPPTTSP
jgi:glucosamine--fructose-6-phosphate aminotransferase (isomerizing)